MKYSVELDEKYQRYLSKALTHLEKSYHKAVKLPTHLDLCDDDALETWESFTSRFARVVDLYLTKYLRLQILRQDPGFEGTLRDHLYLAEKLGYISSAEIFLSFREFRNIQAHDYTEESFESFVRGLLQHAPALLDLRKKFP